MDVLSIIKKDHDQICCLLDSLSSGMSLEDFHSILPPLSAALSDLMRFEAEYLFPEVQDLFVGSEQFIGNALKNQKKILDDLEQLRSVMRSKDGGSGIKTAILDMVRLVRAHIDDQRDLLIPRIRKLIPTQEREDLGEVFIESKQEIRATAAIL
ncbi:MAG: hemerythrin domain-containing protein [Bdellovibrionota bacterium]